MSYNAGIETLGPFEAWILTAVARLDDNAYGMSIHDEMQRLSGRRTISLGAIYTALERLEKKGMVSSRFGDATPQRGGRPKRLYTIEGSGKRSLDSFIHQGRAMAVALKPTKVAG